MRSFLKPSTTKFGLAAASSLALVAAPTVALPANAANFTVSNCNASGAGSLAQALINSDATSGPNEIDIEISNDCTVTVVDTMVFGESVTIRNSSKSEFVLKSDAANDGPILMTDPLASTYETIDLEIEGVVFDGNNVGLGSPLILLANSYYVTDTVIRDSVFLNAEAGAILAYAQNGLRIYDSNFYENFATQGGAILSLDTPTLIKDSTFYGNDANIGGSVAIGTTDETVSYGGAVITGSTFSNGNASYGGAIAVTGDDEFGEPYGNFLASNLLIQDSTFTNNQGSGGGGAVFATDATVTVWGITSYSANMYERPELSYSAPYSSTFTNNTGSIGGAIAISSGRLVSVGNYFGYNSSDFGGAIAALGEKGVTPDSESLVSYLDFFTNNEARLFGGAISATDLERALVGLNTMTENAANYAPAVYASDNESTQIISSNIAYNNSNLGGAVVVSGATELESEDDFVANVIAGNTFMDNYAYADMYGVSLSVVGSEENAMSLFSNIFAASDPSIYQLHLPTFQRDLGANLATGPFSQIDSAGVLPSYPDAVEGESALVTWEQLDLQPLAINQDNPVNLAPWPTIALGEDSVAIDYFNFDSPGLNLPEDPAIVVTFALIFDSRFVTRTDDELKAIHGTGLDVGAFELGDSEPTPTDPKVVITDVSKSSISATGDTFSVYGRGLDDVTELYIGGVKVSFVVVSATELRVVSGALSLGTQEILAIATDGRAVYQLAVGVVEEPSYWTKNLGNGQAKIYAKNIVGEGKVQFFLNGKEIAWINAIDETDPKLRKANGAAYLVRTVNLTSGKNRLEVKVDGVRVRFTTYSR